MADSMFANARILVTGATSGIGEATVEAFCKAGAGELIVVGRREDRLKELARNWSDTYGNDVAAVVLDVGSKQDIEAVAEQHPQLFDVDILVNNAGLALGRDALWETPTEDWEAMVQTNVLGLLYMTKAVLPNMLGRGGGEGSGHIVNLGSVAGRWTYTGGAVYSATKAAVTKITEGLRMDLLGKKVRVTNIEPGMVETEFSLVRFKGDAAKAKSIYQGMTPLSPQDIADTILWVCSRPPHVNIQELVVYPTDQPHVGMVHRAAN